MYDELDLQRATQLYLDMYPAFSMRGMMIGKVRDYGSRNSSQISVTANRLDSNAMFMTGNTESIYAMLAFDTKVDGPTWSIYTQASAHNEERKNPVTCWKLSYNGHGPSLVFDRGSVLNED